MSMLKDYNDLGEWKSLFKNFRKKNPEALDSIVKDAYPDGLEDLFTKFSADPTEPTIIRQTKSPTKEQIEKIKAFYTMGKIMLEAHFVINRDVKNIAEVKIEGEKK